MGQKLFEQMPSVDFYCMSIRMPFSAQQLSVNKAAMQCSYVIHVILVHSYHTHALLCDELLKTIMVLRGLLLSGCMSSRLISSNWVCIPFIDSQNNFVY